METAYYWKRQAINAQEQRDIALSALNMMIRAFNVEEIDPLIAFSTIEKAKAALESCVTSNLNSK